MSTAYLWIKAAHVIAVIAWMAGLLYLPRLFVYHTQTMPGSEAAGLFKVMERRLMVAITLPAAVASWLLGLLLLAELGRAAGEGWVRGKLILVVALTVYMALLERWRRALRDDRNRHSERFFRIVNEVPTLLMIGIVLLVVAKPF